MKDTFPWLHLRFSCGSLVPNTCCVIGVEHLRSTAQRCQNCCSVQVKESTLVLLFTLCTLLAGRSQPGQMVHINKHSLIPPEQVCLARWVNPNKQKGESIQCKCFLSSRNLQLEHNHITDLQDPETQKHQAEPRNQEKNCKWTCTVHTVICG